MVVNHVATMQVWALSLALASMALVLMVMLFIVQPTIQAVEANRDGVLSLFAEVRSMFFFFFFFIVFYIYSFIYT